MSTQVERDMPSCAQRNISARAEFLRFVAVGGLAASVNVGMRIVFSRVMVFEAAVVAAYGCGMVTAFLLNRWLVFTHAARAPAGGQAWRFVLVNLVALAQVWAVSEALLRLIFPALGYGFHPQTCAHAIAVASPIVTSYFGHKHFSFAAKAVG